MLRFDSEAQVPWTSTCDHPGETLVVDCPGAATEEEAEAVLAEAGGLFPYLVRQRGVQIEVDFPGHLRINHRLPFGTVVRFAGEMFTFLER